MSNASDSTVEQTKETLYTVILLNFTKKEKTPLYSHMNKNDDNTYAKPNMKYIYAQY